ncbi:HNH endonuclease signature motif containing protein [Limosilactobacillus mucosae]
MSVMDRLKQRAKKDAATMSRAELIAKEKQLDRLLTDLDLGLCSFDAQSVQALSRSTAKPRLGLYPVRATSLVSADQANELRETAKRVQYQRLWLSNHDTLVPVPRLPEFKQLKGWVVDLATAHLYNSRGVESRATKHCTIGTNGYIKVADTMLHRVVMASWINAVNPDLLGVLDYCHVHHVNPNAKKTLAGNTLDHLALIDRSDHAKLTGAQRALTKYFDQLYQN